MKLVRVQTTNGIQEAEILKKMLESYGIPVTLRYESYGRVAGITVDGLGAVDIIVPENRVQEALELLNLD